MAGWWTRWAGRRRSGAAPAPAGPEEAFDAAEQLRMAYMASHDPRHLAAGVRLARIAVAGTPAGQPRHAFALTTLGTLLRLSWERDGSRKALDEAVAAGRAAVAAVTADGRADPASTAQHLSALATSLQELFEASRETAVLEEAIALYRRTLVLLPSAHPEYAGQRGNLGNALLRLDVERPDPAVLDEAAVHQRAAVRHTAPGTPAHTRGLINLAGTLMRLAGTSRSVVALDEAAEAYRAALARFPDGHPQRGRVEEAAARAEGLRQALRAATADTERTPDGRSPANVPAPEAPRPPTRAVRASPVRRPPPVRPPEPLRPNPPVRPDEPRQRPELAALERAQTHFTRYEEQGSAADLEQAISGFGALVQMSGDGEIRFEATNGLGTSHWSRYERLGEPGDLDTAVRLFRTALGTVPPQHPGAPAVRANLAGTLQLRWQRLGAPQDLTEAVDLHRAVLATTPADDPRRPGRVSGLGTCMLALALHHHDSSALAEAVVLLRESADGPGRPTPPAAWSNLGEALRQQAEWGGGGPEALDEALGLARRAVAATGTGHPLHARFQSNLAFALAQRFRERAEPPDLADAVQAAHRAVAATPEGHPNLADRLRMHAQVLRMAYDRDPGPATLDALVGAAQDAVRATPPQHRQFPVSLALLAYALDVRAVTEEDAGALAASGRLWRLLARDEAVPVSERVSAARRWGLGALQRDDWVEADHALQLAVQLLPRVAPRRIGRSDRERQLAALAGLASDAAACALGLGDPERAVQLLEQGRGILLGQALDARTEVTELHRLHPDLARRFEELREALDRPEHPLFTGPSEAPDGSPAEAPLPGRDRHALAQAWEELVGEIRSRPGFTDFLRPPRTAQLMAAAAADGPVVILNHSGLRTDALLVTTEGVRLVPLPGLTHGAVSERVGAFVAAVDSLGDPALSMTGQLDAQDTVRAALDWLGTEVAEPVLTALSFDRPAAPGAVRPRLWWVPTGALTALPLHAAGPVLDRVVSSYAPTLRGLVAARERAAVRERARQDAAAVRSPLVVALPRTPDAPELPGVLREAGALTRHRPDSRVLTAGQATRRAVLDALPDHPWVHFGCHAVAAADGAATGRLLLHDHRERPLTVADVSRLHLGGAELAYLSACGTVRTRDDLADEALHLTGGFLMAGYTHVIGTLWTADDEAATRLTTAFYAALVGPGHAAGDPALALDEAVRAERDRYPDTPTLWAAHLHMGP
ncbi:CHAT domain-containing protein [Streptomyces sp. IBSNAI002]|uniref:CHAT domain-containing protein n=1 Tax=Streptomyces sp. IBSNAI002 TaxID=3457500 RepID=UPI003FD6BB19